MAMTATLNSKLNQMTIIVDLLPAPRVSSTGKTKLVATATKKVDVEIAGEQVTIQLNAFIK